MKVNGLVCTYSLFELQSHIFQQGYRNLDHPVIPSKFVFDPKPKNVWKIVFEFNFLKTCSVKISFVYSGINVLVLLLYHFLSFHTRFLLAKQVLITRYRFKIIHFNDFERFSDFLLFFLNLSIKWAMQLFVSTCYLNTIYNKTYSNITFRCMIASFCLVGQNWHCKGEDNWSKRWKYGLQYWYYLIYLFLNTSALM